MTPVSRRFSERGFARPAGMLGRVGARLMVRGNGPTERQIVKLASCRPGESALVLGPGPGVGVRELLGQGVEVTAVDPSTLMLAETLRRCRDVVVPDARLTLRVGTAQEHGAASGSMDVVLSVNNVMIWPDRRAALAAIVDALRPGGRLLISVHTRWLPDGLVDDCESVGFDTVDSWTSHPSASAGRAATQVSALRGRR